VQEILALKNNVARVGPYVARDHGEQRRLSGAVGTNDAYGVARLQLEGDLLANNNLTELLRDTFQLKQRHERTS
jgi:hypothetical protein